MSNVQNIVVFDPIEFREIYPQFASLTDATLNYYFIQAEQYLDNSVASPVANLEKRKVMLYLLTCHIATLAQRGDNVGALASAGEGSVSVSFATPNIKNAEYFTQTPCGLAYWQMSLPYRLSKYYGPC